MNKTAKDVAGVLGVVVFGLTFVWACACGPDLYVNRNKYKVGDCVAYVETHDAEDWEPGAVGGKITRLIGWAEVVRVGRTHYMLEGVDAYNKGTVETESKGVVHWMDKVECPRG